MNPGKNMTVICETIAMNQLLKLHGYHTAKEFNRRLKDYMKKKQTTSTKHTAKVLPRDFE
jgi:HPr kinase/phosphorylase